jgi:pimeloyl-ACP methyl ester carboxylesterase
MAADAVMRPVEDHFFFDEGTLYARTFLPGESRGVGVVIVPPIGRERTRINLETSGLCRDLALAGFPVLRFDARGDGESAGAFCDSTIETRVADTVAAAGELRRRARVGRIALAGFHLGASIAVLAAEDAGADLLVLGDPVCDPRQYVAGLLRTVVFQRRQHLGETGTAEADLRSSLRSGGVVNVFGFHAGAGLIDGIERLDVGPALRAFAGRSTILRFSSETAASDQALTEWRDLLGGAARCGLSTLAMGFSWTTRKRWTTHLEPLDTAIVDWLTLQADRYPEPVGGAGRS